MACRRSTPRAPAGIRKSGARCRTRTRTQWCRKLSRAKRSTSASAQACPPATSGTRSSRSLSSTGSSKPASRSSPSRRITQLRRCRRRIAEISIRRSWATGSRDVCSSVIVRVQSLRPTRISRRFPTRRLAPQRLRRQRLRRQRLRRQRLRRQRLRRLQLRRPRLRRPRLRLHDSPQPAAQPAPAEQTAPAPQGAAPAARRVTRSGTGSSDGSATRCTGAGRSCAEAGRRSALATEEDFLPVGPRLARTDVTVRGSRESDRRITSTTPRRNKYVRKEGPRKATEHDVQVKQYWVILGKLALATHDAFIPFAAFKDEDWEGAVTATEARNFRARSERLASSASASRANQWM